MQNTAYMRNGYPYSFIKKIGILLLILVSAFQVNAQIDIPIGTGTTGNGDTYPCPIQDWYEGGRAQFLFQASELTAAGMAPGTIQSIKFNVINLNGAGITEKMVIKMGGTSVTTLSTSSWDVFSGSTVETDPIDYQPVTGSNVFTFVTPFFWNGVDNILIEICNGDPGNATGTWYTHNPEIPWTTGLSFNGSHSSVSDNLGSLCNSTGGFNTGTQTTRPDIAFSWVPATVCTGKPEAGTAISSSANVCFSQNFTLSLTGQTIASGITYKWQSSANNTTWTDITGATTSTLATSQSTTSWYRAIVTCTNGGLMDTSFAVQVASPALVSGAYTINSTLPTAGNNFKSFNDAVNYIRCGISASVVFTVSAGPYAEQVTIPAIPGTSTVNTVTFNCNGATLSYNTSDAANRTAVILNGASHIIFDSLNIDVSSGTYGWGILLTNKADSNIIRRCTINTSTTSTSTNYAGLLINGSTTVTNASGNNGSGNIISGNTINGGYYGIDIYGNTAGNANNIIENNIIRDAYYTFIYSYGVNGLIIRGNDLSRPSRSAVTSTNGIYVGGADVIVDKNRIHNLFDAVTGSNVTVYCISSGSSGTSAAQPNKITNNLIYNINNGAGAVYGIWSSGYNNWNIYNNSIVLDDAAATAGAVYGCYANGSDVNVKNNLIYVTRAGTGAKYCLYYPSAGVTSSDNNDLYINSASGTTNIGFFNATGWPTLAGWQGATGFDLSSVSLDPQFVNAANGNYSPANVFLDNMAVPVGITTDLNGTTRSSTTPDIGAIEFTSQACTTPPVPGTVVSTANPICAGRTFTLSLTGGTAGSGQTYQWQSSADNVVWTNIPGAVSAVYSTSQTGNTWYRVSITCGTTVFSVPLQVITTPVAYATLPFTESFEDTWINGCDTRDIPNNFWRSNPGTGNNSWRRNDDGTSALWANPNNGMYTPAASNGNYSARFHTYGSNSGTSGSLDFFVNCNTGIASKRVRFDYINTTGSDSMAVWLSTDGGATFTRLNGFTVNSSWDRKVINFTSTSATTVLRFRSTSDFGTTDIGIDNLAVYNLEDCAGVPASGTTVSTGNNVCPGTSFTLSVNGLPLQNGLTYQWQSSTDNVTYNNITGATGESLTTTQTATKWYRIVITCTNSAQTATSTPVQVVMKAPVYAPLPYSESFENTWVNGCDTRDVPNSFWNNNPVTGDPSWRRNDDGASANWGSANGNYAPTASAGLYSARFHSYDADGGDQGKFDLYVNAGIGAPNKRLTFSTINTSGDDTLAIFVSRDGGATFTYLDSVGLRSSWSQKTIFFNSGSATTVIRFEATSDFGFSDIGIDDILVAEWPDCSGTPNSGTAVSSVSTVCVEPFTVSATGVSTGNGITYQWQQSVDSVTWTNITGATGLSYTSTQVGTHFYRLVTTCTLTGTSANSAGVKIISPLPVHGVFTIDNTLPTGGINFASFNDAYQFIKCGIDSAVLFNVKTGTGLYNEQLIMSAIPGASSDNTVTFKGNGVATIGFASTNTNQRAVIKLKGTRNIIFDSLVIKANTGTYGYGVQLMGNTDSNEVKNCTINLSTTSSTQNFAGIVVNGADAGAVTTGTVLSDYNIFSGNTINGGYYGITLVATFDNGANGNNKILNNTIKDFYQYGIYVSGSYGTIIEKNIISRPTRTSVTDFYGIYFTTEKNTGCAISKNRITNPFGAALASTATFYGINFNGSSGSTGGAFNENVVSNNLIYKINGNGPQYGIANTGSSYAYYFHNTISLDSIGSTSTSLTRGFSQTTTAGGLFFYNNIIQITRGGTGTKYCIYLGSNLPAGADNNNYYINSPAGTNSVGYYTAARAQLANWRTATGLDMTSLSVTPAFVAPDLGDYTPGNAGIDNKGVGLGITDDIKDQGRNGITPDIGAYEFTPLPCSVPPVTGTLKITPDTICQYRPVYLHLNIGAFGSGQTFQWQTAKDKTGPYTNLGMPMLTPDTTVIADTTIFFRIAISCGTNIVYSDTAKLVVNPALPTGTYTINKTISGSYIPGKPGGNFVSFADAKAAMGCGIGGAIVFNVEQGTGPYTEQLILDSIPGTSAINTITFNGHGNTLIFNGNTSAQRAVIKLNGADHIIFDSLVIATGTGTYGYGVQLINNADSNTFRKCTINTSLTATSTNFAGIVINSSDASAVSTGNTLCDGNLFDGNTINGGYYGITLVGNTTVAAYLNNNSITNNTINDFYNYGLYVTGTTGTVIAGNTFTRPARTNTATNVYGIYLTTAASDNLHISKNRFTSFFTGVPTSTSSFYGIYHNSVTAAAEDTVSNNLFYKLDGNGPVYALYNTGSGNIWYYHNTISIDNTVSTATGVSVGFYHTSSVTGLKFINNIITITRGGTGNKHGIYLNSTTSELLSDNNDIYVNATNAYVGYFSGNRSTLADWTAATAKDGASFSLNPLFIDVDAGNGMPQLIAIDNKGIPVNIATDIMNAARSATTPDIGAYEYVPQPCVNPPVAGTASVTPSSGVCLETPIELNITGHSPLGAIKFVWQSADNASSTNWTNISDTQYFPKYNYKVTLNTWFRAAVICNGNTVYTTPVNVTLNNVLITGVYTIDPAQGPTSTNFVSFQSAVDALLCGITGWVRFDVAPGTYNEQIRIPYIPNTSSVNTVTFQSANGNAGAVNLTYDGTGSANYTLKLDSAKYFIFKNLTITGTNVANARVIELANTASYDSIVNCIVSAPAVTTPSTNVVGIYANQLKGSNNVIRGNTISNGSSGIYIAGTAAGINLTPDHVIDSNTISGAWQFGIYTSFIKRLELNKNSITVNSPVNSTAYGVYATDCDSSYHITGNNITLSNTNTVVYGMSIVNCDTALTERGTLAANIITAVTGNTGSLYGLYLSNSPGILVQNNVVAINTTGASSYGLYHNNFSIADYFNNSINSTATSATNNFALYLQNTTASGIQLRNNIFSHKGGGKAMYVNNSSSAYTSDYNMLYTTGSTLVQRAAPAGTYATLADWKAASYWDKYSITYTPAFVSDTDLHPDLVNPDVWAMHGRGIQITTNDHDINDNPRPVTLTQGVPDLGAYEFYPTALPTVLTAIPAAPAPNTTQTFMYGTDSVMKIMWGPTPPPSVEARRFSGVVPSGLQPRPDSMFFYTKVEIPGGGNYDYNMELFYLDPWQGSVPDQYMLGVGKTTVSNAWIVGFSSRVDVNKKKITQHSMNYIDRFTGLVNPYAPPVLPEKDSSNRGKRFWVGYQKSYDFTNGNSQQMVLYMSTTDQPANVQVRIAGTNWIRNYVIPPFTTQATESLPKAGADDARLMNEGLYNRGISITSDVPITAYAHEYAATNSGSTMLFPVGVWGYEYYSINNKQFYLPADCYTTIMVVADNNNTVVEITPSVPTLGGRPANTPFRVTLNAGEVYQVLGAMISGSSGYDLTGSVIKSVPNSSGKCYPIGVYSGSSRTGLGCGASSGSSGDLFLQQTWPYSAWGKKYLTAPTTPEENITSRMTNIYRVMVKDSSTAVLLNGDTLKNLINNRYYQFESNSTNVITANKPVMTVEYMSSSGNCPGTGFSGDPDSYILSPAEQAIDGFSGFYRNSASAIIINYLTLILPDSGMNSLKIDGVPWDQIPAANKHSYPHAQPGYTVAIKKWLAGSGQSSVSSDSAYLGLVFGLGTAESYGYNVGTMVKTLQGLGAIKNTLNNGTDAEYTCEGTPFRFTGYLPFKPTSLTWKFSSVPGLSPGTDVTVVNPAPSDSTLINGIMNYVFPVNQDYTFAAPGVYTVEIIYDHPDIESCDHTGRDLIYIQVVPAPKADFTVNFSGCVKDIAQLTGEATAQNGIAVNEWNWTLHDGTKPTGQHTSYTYNTPGTYSEKLQSITADGCIGDTTKQIVVNPQPIVKVNNISVCTGHDTTLAVENPVAGSTYNWYTSATGGTAIGTGPTLLIQNVTASTDYYVQETSAAGCSSEMTKLSIAIQSAILKPEVAVDSVTASMVKFKWNAVPGATGYEVSLDGGNTWSTPSSGTTGLTHTIANIPPMQTVTIIVKALGGCANSLSVPVSQQVLPDGIFIPNSFTPNGDGLNDMLKVYGYKIREMQLMVFNQWGEKLFETRDQSRGWDGTFRGKQQPSGVYMYVCRMILTDGTTIDKRGAVNLIR